MIIDIKKDAEKADKLVEKMFEQMAKLDNKEIDFNVANSQAKMGNVVVKSIEYRLKAAIANRRLENVAESSVVGSGETDK